MYKQNIIHNMIIVLISSILLLILLLTSFNVKIYDLDIYDRLHRETGVYSHFNESLAKDRSIELVSFFKSDSSLDKNFYTSNEIIHLEDVKRIFGFLKISYLILIVLLVSGLIYLYLETDFLQSLIKIIFIQLAICLFLGSLLYLLPFDFLFEKMHELFFPQGNYSFDPMASNLINLFPIGFFIGFTKDILKMFFIMELIIFHLGIIFYAKKKCLFKTIFK